MSGARPFDWPGLMRAGMQGLGLKPHEFWALRLENDENQLRFHQHLAELA